jgi:hypothetical protein
MMRKIIVINSLSLALALMLSACGNAAPTQDPAVLAAQLAAQVEAQVSTRVAQAMASFNATQKAIPTAAPLPTVGSIPTLAPVNVPTLALPGVATTTGCNPPPIPLGENYPDGSLVYINTAFSKSWTIQNAGTCTWNSNYKLRFVSGDAMGGPTGIPFSYSVPPGGSIKLTLPLKTPSGPGTITGYWGLYDDKDTYFGRVWATINVITVPPTSTAFAVSSVTIAKVTGACKFTATITTNGAGTIQYRWIHVDGASINGALTDLAFSGATAQTVTSPVYAGTTTGVSIYVLPNHLEWNASAAIIPAPCA